MLSPRPDRQQYRYACDKTDKKCLHVRLPPWFFPRRGTPGASIIRPSPTTGTLGAARQGAQPNMCGIVAATARENVVPILIAGLKALEYRGYDSAGIAILEGDRLTRVRTPGKVRDLESLYLQSPVEGFPSPHAREIPTGHTRVWLVDNCPMCLGCRRSHRTSR